METHRIWELCLLNAKQIWLKLTKCWWVSCCCSCSDAFRPLLPRLGGHGIYTIRISGWVFNKRLSLTSCCQKLKSKRFNSATCSSLAQLQPEARPRLRMLSEGSTDCALACCDPPSLHLVSLMFNEIGSALRVFYTCCPTKPNRVTCCSTEIDAKNRAEWCLFPFLCTFFPLKGERWWRVMHYITAKQGVVWHLRWMFFKLYYAAIDHLPSGWQMVPR